MNRLAPVLFCLTTLLTPRVVAQDPSGSPDLDRILGQIGKLESNRDPKCFATATRLENFMFGTPLTQEARQRKTELQKALVQRVWQTASTAATKAGENEISAQQLLASLPKLEAEFSEVDLDHYSSVAYSLRAVLAARQDALLTPGSEALLPLDEEALSTLTQFLDRHALAVLKHADATARAASIREISDEAYAAAWAKFDSESASENTPDEDARRGIQRYSVITPIIQKKIEAYDEYNEISEELFVRNLEVYFARSSLPLDEEERAVFRDEFTGAMVHFARQVLQFSAALAHENRSPLIRMNHVETAIQTMTPFAVNDFEDVVFFPRLPRQDQVLLESYDCDAFRDSGLHWRYLQYALEDEVNAGFDVPEPDPFAAELLAESFAQFAVLVLRLAGKEANARKSEELRVEDVLAAFQRIQELGFREREIAANPPEPAQFGEIASSDPAAAQTEPLFADVTSELGVDFTHRISDWLSRAMRSYIERPDGATEAFNISPAFSGSGAAAEDVDGDGLPDLLLLSGLGNRLYLNKGGKFEDVTAQSGLDWKRPDGTHGEPRQPIIADFDNDGLQDVLIIYVNDSHRLYRNLGDARFEDVTERAGLGGKGLVAVPATTCDLDNDGLLDLYIGYYGNFVQGVLPSLSRYNDNASPNQLFRNKGDFVFENITGGSGVADRGWAQAVGHSDFDGDGLQDLIAGNDFGVNAWFRNLGNGQFEDVSERLGTKKPSYTMNIGIADLNRDRIPDFYLSNIVTMVKDEKYVLPDEDTRMRFNQMLMARMRVIEANDLFLSNAVDGKLERYEMSERVGRGFSSTGWSWDADFFDFDHDGDDDLYVVNGLNEYAAYTETPFVTDTIEGPKQIFLPSMTAETNVFFINDDGRLDNAGPETGLALTANSRSAVYLDFDDDGDLDIALNNYHGKAFVFRNDSPAPETAWLKIKLVGDVEKGVNRDAIGARIIVTRPNGETVWREVHGTIGYLSVHPKEQHLGLGAGVEAVDVEITWPNGEVQQLPGLKPNSAYEIRQNEASEQ